MLTLDRIVTSLALVAACVVAGPSTAERSAITSARACKAAGGDLRRYVVPNGGGLDALLVDAPGLRRVTVSRLRPSTSGVDPRRLRVITPETPRATDAPELIPGREIQLTTQSVRLRIYRNREGGPNTCAQSVDSAGYYCAGDQNRPVEICVRVRAPRGPSLLARHT